MSQPGHDASKVRASGPGLDTKGVSASLPVEFTIDARDAGEGLLTVQILVGSIISHSVTCNSWVIPSVVTLIPWTREICNYDTKTNFYIDRIQRASQKTQPSKTTGMGRTQCPMSLTLRAPTPSPLNMEEMRFPTPRTASSLCPQETPANVFSQVTTFSVTVLMDKTQRQFVESFLDLFTTAFFYFAVSVGGHGMCE